MYCAICSHAKTIKDKFIIYYPPNFYFESSVSLQSASLLLNPLLKTVLSINQLSQVSPRYQAHFNPLQLDCIRSLFVL